jgi:hypothetical protein
MLYRGVVERSLSEYQSSSSRFLSSFDMQVQCFIEQQAFILSSWLGRRDLPLRPSVITGLHVTAVFKMGTTTVLGLAGDMMMNPIRDDPKTLASIREAIPKRQVFSKRRFRVRFYVNSSLDIS